MNKTEEQACTLAQCKREFINFLKENNAYEAYKYNVRQNKQLTKSTSTPYSLFSIININPFSPLIKKAYSLYNGLTFDEDDAMKCRRDYVKIHICELINYAFTWAETKEGELFWRRLDSKWKHYLKQKSINITF